MGRYPTSNDNKPTCGSISKPKTQFQTGVSFDLAMCSKIEHVKFK